MGLAFAGLALAMSDGFLAQQGIDWQMFAGDLIGLAGGAFWGVTTVAIRASALSEVSPVKTLMYELGFTGALLTPMAWLLGEFDSFHFTLTSSLSLAYQTTILCSASYLGWLILLRRYLATRLAVFSFLTPIIAAVFGWLILGDAISHSFIGGGVLETRLQGRSWIMGEEFTIADISLLGWVRNLVGFYGAGELVKYHSFTGVQAWLERCLQRPAVQRGLEIPARP